MIVVLFGAGASFGAQHVLNRPPPLGSGLYDELRIHFPFTWGRLPPEIDQMFKTHFEDGMGFLWSQMKGYVPTLLQQLAVFFGNFRLDGTKKDSYSRFIIKLEKEGILNRVVFSTLNYECLLEFAMNQCNRQVNYFELLESNKDSNSVLKLHGSCNFLPHRIGVGRGVLIGPGVGIEGGLRIASNLHEVQRFCNSNTSLHPSMAIYMKGKPIQNAPSTIRQIQNIWKESILQASDVVTIGVNPWPDDKHIWDPISRTNAKLLFIGNESVFNDWREKFRKKRKSVFIGNRFHLHYADAIRNLSGAE